MLIINGVAMPEPEDYTPKQEPVLANVMQNGYGEDLADFIRVRSVLSLKWDWVPPSELIALQSATDPASHPDIDVTYDTPGGIKTGRFRVSSPVGGTRMVPDPLYGVVWADVSLELREV